MHKRIRILLVDDDPLVRSTFRIYLETAKDIDVVAEAENGVQCLRILDAVRPTVVLADIHMPHMDGISLLKEIQKRDNPPVFLGITAFDSDDTMLKILRAGGAGYILKNQRPPTIIEAIREAVVGGTVVAPVAMHRLVDYLDTAPPRDPVADAAATHGLDEREAAVLRLILQGNSNTDIAAALGISASTVKKTVSHLMSVFRAPSRLTLVSMLLGGAGI